MIILSRIQIFRKMVKSVVGLTLLIIVLQTSNTLRVYVNVTQSENHPVIFTPPLLVPKKELVVDVFIVVDPEIKLETECQTTFSASATIGSTNLRVEQPNDKNSLPKIEIPHDLGVGDHRVNFEYSTVENCQSMNPSTSVLSQAIPLSIFDYPELQYTSDLPDTMSCSSELNSSSGLVWLSYEKNGALLGYCGPNSNIQQYIGGYSLYHPLRHGNVDRSMCILQMKERQIGNYTCSIWIRNQQYTSIEIPIRNRDKMYSSSSAETAVIVVSIFSFILLVIVIAFSVYHVYKCFRRQLQNNHEQLNDQ